MELTDDGQVHAGDQCERDDEREQRIENEKWKQQGLLSVLFAIDETRRVRTKLGRGDRKRQRVERAGEHEQCHGQNAIGALLEKGRGFDWKEDGDETMARVGQCEVRREKRRDVTQVDGQHTHR